MNWWTCPFLTLTLESTWRNSCQAMFFVICHRCYLWSKCWWWNIFTNWVPEVGIWSMSNNYITLNMTPEWLWVQGIICSAFAIDMLYAILSFDCQCLDIFLQFLYTQRKSVVLWYGMCRLSVQYGPETSVWFLIEDGGGNCLYKLALVVGFRVDELTKSNRRQNKRDNDTQTRRWKKSRLHCS